jgi:hypothetical protein
MPSLKCSARTFRLLEGYAEQRLTKRSTSRVFVIGLSATVVVVQSERENRKSLAAFVRGEKHGWFASQTLIKGLVKAASVCRRAFFGVRSDVAEGATKSAYLQSIGARRTQASAV